MPYDLRYSIKVNNHLSIIKSNTDLKHIMKIKNESSTIIDLINPLIQKYISQCSVLIIIGKNIIISPHSIPHSITHVIISNAKTSNIQINCIFPSSVTHILCNWFSNKISNSFQNSISTMYIAKSEYNKYLPNCLQYLRCQCINPIFINYLPPCLLEFLPIHIHLTHNSIIYYNLPIFLNILRIDASYKSELNNLPPFLLTLILKYNLIFPLRHLPKSLENIMISDAFMSNNRTVDIHSNYHIIYDILYHNKSIKNIYYNSGYKKIIKNINSYLTSLLCNDDPICKKRNSNGNIIHKCYSQYILKTYNSDFISNICDKYETYYRFIH